MDTLFLAYLRNYKGFMENFRETGTGGTIATFNALANTQVKNLKIGIEAVQSGSGDPSPDNVRPITGWTQAKVTRCGKNLFSASTATLMDNVVLNRDTGLVASESNMASLYIRCQPNTTYTISRTKHSATWRFNAGYTKELPAVGISVYGFPNILYPSVDADGRGSITITTGADAKYLFVYLCWKTMETIADAESDLQIEVSPNVTPYEPYNSTTYTIDLDGTVYGGTLDVTKGELTVTTKMIDMGAMVWSKAIDGGFSTPLTGAPVGLNLLIISSIFKYDDSFSFAWNKFDSAPDNTLFRNSGNNNLYCKCTSATTEEAFSTICEGQKLVFELATPQTFAVTPKQIFALEGANNMWADTGDIISFDYYGES